MILNLRISTILLNKDLAPQLASGIEQKDAKICQQCES